MKKTIQKSLPTMLILTLLLTVLCTGCEFFFSPKAQLDSNGGIIWAETRIEQQVRTILGKSGGVIMPSDLNSITSFTCQGGYMDSLSLVDLVHFKNLTELTVGDFCGEIDPIKSLTKLTKLELNKHVDDSGLRILSGLTNLTYLEFDGIGSFATNISPLGRLTNLTSLRFRYGTLDICDISPLSKLINLTELFLSGDISDISPLANLTKLTKLDLHDNYISNLNPLSGLINLTWLDLERNQITDISALSNLKKLNQLGLYGYDETNKIDDWSPVAHVENVSGRPE